MTNSWHGGSTSSSTGPPATNGCTIRDWLRRELIWTTSGVSNLRVVSCLAERLIMKRFLVLCVVVTALVAWAGGRVSTGAEQTWTGMISDSQCGGDHGGEVDVRECTLKCTRQGDKYVLATENGVKVIPIANQNFA